MTLSAPIEFANVRAFLEISVTIISSAPALLEAAMHNVPIGPDPVIKTFCPKIFPTYFIAWRQTASGSAIAASSGDRPSAGTHWKSSAINVSLNSPCMCGNGIADT